MQTTPDVMNIGDIFYECQSGYNIKCKVLTRPEWVLEEYAEKTRKHWTWFAENVFSGEKITYGLTEGLEHYGPRIYSEPQYVHFKDGVCSFKFIGEPKDV
jgi:hypothetical protein